MNKSIILIMPHHFHIYEAFTANLEKLGFKIELLYTSDQDFRYKNISQKITNFFRKTFLGDRDYKKHLKDHFDDESLLKALSKITAKVDHALVIRPDYFSAETLRFLKSKTNQLIAYQWDGLDRYPKVKELIPIFDRFFLFDVDDFEKYKAIYPNVFPTTNFYFDFESEIDFNTVKSNSKQVFFIGSFIESRIEETIKLTNTFKDLDFKTNINLLYFDEKTPLKYAESGISFLNKPLTYLETLKLVRENDVVLDFEDTVHNGLSLRIFETLHYSKKLITTNQLVRNHDFYSPDNILIWDKSVGKNEITDFLSKDYQIPDQKILARYSFTHWIKTVLHL